jgi:DNA-binding transcriptional LysR family regulator
VQFTQLSYFVAVAEARHFTRAAERMGVAQPSLSQQVRALENDLGAPLFHRERGNVTLTSAGEVLLPIARRLLADAEMARNEIRELGELRTGRVRLGATPSLCTGLLPAILADFHAAYPGIEIALQEGGSRDLERNLGQGGLDLALIIESVERRDPDLTAMAVLEEDLVVVSPQHRPPPVPGPRIRVADLEGLSLVMFRRGYDLRDVTLAACREAGFEPSFAIEGGEMDAVLGFVQAGMGVAVVPSTVVEDRFRSTPFVAPGIRRTVSLAHRRDVDPPRAAAAMQEQILSYLFEAGEAGQLPPGVRLPGPTRAPS